MSSLLRTQDIAEVKLAHEARSRRDLRRALLASFQMRVGKPVDAGAPAERGLRA